MLYLLKEIESAKILVDLPNFIKASDFNTADNYNSDKPCHHDHRLKYICPNNSLQTTLMAENNAMSMWIGL